ncbi:1,4-dihydroxy-2-naphthoate octaprenyltransferase [Parachlamydia sp. AcF125]|uniref:1,4-dihydroxy-2-naphthoate octaprenyltransferase n=1 Tax=Parachlamydia sp. AcF125 TaxID=2795736 RepID=UPI001BC8E6C3|nr:1,4-dihydroxy-2-naphthoate octaprenyltransferase [Parachlamydia sp. AcF125]MBS4168893.1 1,4-dihydroxy-2-naphthoate octaprenyltransferase [Parachlamydia sp. AcF125]
MVSKNLTAKLEQMRPWILTARPKTLVASFVPTFIGTSLAIGLTKTFEGWTALFALLSAIFIQTGTNLVNDALDFQKGADNEARLGPVRVTQLGLLTSQQILWGGLLSFLLALCVGIPLVLKGGPILFLTLVLSAICGYLYTGGPFPLAYVGLGDLFVIIFFGWVATCSAFYLQTGNLGILALLAGTQVGLHSTVMIAINNLRDVEGDAKVNKRTLAVRFGKVFVRKEITFLIFCPFILNLAWLMAGFYLAATLPLLLLPLAIRLNQDIWKTEPSPAYNGFLARGALLHFIFGGLQGLGFILS